MDLNYLLMVRIEVQPVLLEVIEFFLKTLPGAWGNRNTYRRVNRKSNCGVTSIYILSLQVARFLLLRNEREMASVGRVDAP